MVALWQAVKELASQVRRLAGNMAAVNDEVEARRGLLPASEGPKRIKADR